MKTLPNIHPGEILLEEFLTPMGISQNALARAADVPPRRINEIVLGKRGISADTPVRLSGVLGTRERFWLRLRLTTIWKKHATRSAAVSSISNVSRLRVGPGRCFLASWPMSAARLRGAQEKF